MNPTLLDNYHLVFSLDFLGKVVDNMFEQQLIYLLNFDTAHLTLRVAKALGRNKLSGPISVRLFQPTVQRPLVELGWCVKGFKTQFLRSQPVQALSWNPFGLGGESRKRNKLNPSMHSYG